MSNIYTFGKLHQSRDFVKSKDFTNIERTFWCNWFDTCISSQNFLLFIPKNKQPKIWLFRINFNINMNRIGFICMSQDFTGRSYPFVHYKIYDNKTIQNIDFYKLIEELYVEYCLFKIYLEKGYLIDVPMVQDAMNKEKDLFFTKYVIEFKELLFSNSGEETGLFSNWLELNSLQRFNNISNLTCSFYNKILG